jgi:WD40-like Beta Propeller Repeat
MFGPKLCANCKQCFAAEEFFPKKAKPNLWAVLRYDVFYLSRLAIIGSLLVTGCRYMLGEPAPTPIELMRADPASPPLPCEKSAPPMVPVGQTPLPTTEGELSLVDVRGDDRLAIDGGAMFTWSNDGEKIVSGSEHGVMIWSAVTGVMERHIPIPNEIEHPQRVILSPDGQWIVFVAYMKREDTSNIDPMGFFLMRADGTGAVRRFEKTGDIISFSNDNKRIVGHAHEWDIETGKQTSIPRPKFDHEAKILPGNEKVVVFISNDRPGKQATIPELRDFKTGKVLHRFPEIQSSTGSAISDDGKRIAFVRNGELSVYSVETLERVAFVSDVGNAQMVHLSHDGKRAVTEVLQCFSLLSSGQKEEYKCPNPELTLWDLETGKALWRTPRGSGDAWIFTPDGEYLTGPQTRIVDYLIRLRDNKEVKFGSWIRTISPNSRRVVYNDRNGLSIGALDEKSPVPTFQRADRVLARSADGRFELKVGSDMRVRLENESTCLQLPIAVPIDYKRQPGLDYILDEDRFYFSPDGESLFVTNSATSMHKRYRAFDTKTGQERWSIQVGGRSGGSIQILPLSNQVLFQGSQHPDLIRFNATTGEALPKGGVPRTIYYTPPHLGGLTYEVRGHNGIRAPNLYGVLAGKKGTRLAMMSYLNNDCVFSVWDLRNPRSVDDRFPGCMSSAKALSPDGNWVFAGATKKRAMFIALDHDETRFIADMHQGNTVDVAYTPSGHRVVHADDQGNVVVADPKTLQITGRAKLLLDHAKKLWVAPDDKTIVIDTARGMIVRLRVGGSATN